MRKLIYITFISIGALFVSCDNDSYLDEQEETDKSTISSSNSDMLRFNSSNDLKVYISRLIDDDIDLDEESKNRAERNEHISLLYLYSLNLAELDSININRKKIAIVNSYDDMLHFLLNKNGEIRLENFIYRINGDFVFKYNIGNANDIRNFMVAYNNGRVRIERGETIEYTRNLTVYMHDNNESIADDLSDTILYRNGSNANKSTFTDKSVTSYTYFPSGNTKMRSRQFNGFWFFYSAIGASTKTKIRITYWYWWFGWHQASYWQTKKTDNRLTYDMTYTITNLIFGESYEETAVGNKYCNCYRAKRTFNFAVGVPAPLYYTPSTGQTHHWSHWYSENPNVVNKYLYY